LVRVPAVPTKRPTKKRARRKKSKTSGGARKKKPKADPNVCPLTGALLREPWRLRVEAEIHAALVGGQALTLALLDVDDFSRHVEELETERADALLRGLGGRLQAALPQRTLGRIAGDMFGVLLQGVEVEEALAEIGEARNVATRNSFKLGRGVRRREVSLTLSAGLAGLRRHGRTAAELLGSAQTALWRVKGLGGDRLGLPSRDRMGLKTSYYPHEQLERLKQLAVRQGVKESVLLREALGDLVLKYKTRRPDA
jgi:diguanylate cyclase (GGDEF)-like protein